jgi:hypothetical protein
LQLKATARAADIGRVDREDAFEQRSGAERRRGVERRNGLAVLMAGCSQCDRIAPSPAEMHAEGWLIESDAHGLVGITCPAHLAATKSSDVPDYIVALEDHNAPGRR